MADAHFADFTLQKAFKAMDDHTRYKLHKAEGMNEACRHYMLRLTERAVKL